MTSAYADFMDELEQDVIVPIQPPLDDLAPGTRAVIYLRVSSTGQVRTDYNGRHFHSGPTGSVSA